MTEEIKTSINNGIINITISTTDLWEMMTEEEKENVLRNDVYWYIVSSALKYEFGKSLATPSFNYSLHNLREMITTNPDFVNDVTVSFINALLEELGKAEKKKRQAEAAFWGIYHKMRELEASGRIERMKIDMPSDCGDGEYLRIDTDEVKQLIMDNFVKMLKEANEKAQ